MAVHEDGKWLEERLGEIPKTSADQKKKMELKGSLLLLAGDAGGTYSFLALSLQRSGGGFDPLLLFKELRRRDTGEWH